jgi:hypothetical protein
MTGEDFQAMWNDFEAGELSRSFAIEVPVLVTEDTREDDRELSELRVPSEQRLNGRGSSDQYHERHDQNDDNEDEDEV